MARDATSSRIARVASAGFFSSAARLPLPVGERFDANGVRGYYIDMRAKADAPTWPGGRELHIAAIQWALGCYERYAAGEGEEWLNAARGLADELVASQCRDGRQVGGFIHTNPFRHTFALHPPWISAIAQGEGASLLVRIHLETTEDRYAEAALRALEPLSVDSALGGARAELGGRAWPEEYPTSPPSYVLNGGMFAIWGVRDVAFALDDRAAHAQFDTLVNTLSENLHRWDLGHWSRYDLFPHPTVNVASSFYHNLHINQLRAMNLLAPRPQFADTADRWARNASALLSRQRALARKVLFRTLVPRNPSLARRLAWSRLRRG